MLGTYTVNLMCGTAAYFMQQVLVVPGAESLELLKDVTGNKYHFWDMSLEVPTHPDALTPVFKQIQPSQLLCTSQSENSTNRNEAIDNAASHAEPIRPMCCVLDAESANLQNVKRQGSVDCSGVTKTLYFRRTGKVLGRKRGNMVAVVLLKDIQIDKRTLYISTTARFCRALKYSCVKAYKVLSHNLERAWTNGDFLERTRVASGHNQPRAYCVHETRKSRCQQLV
ncbi:hypothetical protein ACER0C_025817 [Sarotherodon galilaeus]